MTSPLGANETGNPNLPSGAAHPMVPVNGTLVPREVLPPLDVRQALMPPPALSATPNALTLLKALQRRLVLALTVGFIVAAAGGTAAWFLAPPPKQTAKTQIYVSAVAPAILNNVDDNRWNATFMQTQMSFIRQPVVLRAALREPGVSKLSMIPQQLLEDDLIPWLEEKVQIEIAGPEYFRIGISGDKPEELRTLVKAVARAYMREAVGETPQKRKDHLTKLIGVKAKFEKRLDGVRAKLKSLEEALGPPNAENLAAQQKIAQAELRAAQSEYVHARAERRRLQVELGLPERGGRSWEEFAAYMNYLPATVLPVNLVLVQLAHDEPTVLPFIPRDVDPHLPIDPKALGEQIEKDPLIAAKFHEISVWKAKIEEIREKAQPDKFEFASRWHRAQLTKAEKALQQRRDLLLPKLAKDLRDYAEGEARLRWAQSWTKYTNLRATESMLFAVLNQLDEFLKQFKKKAVDAGRLDAEHQKLEKFLDQAENKIVAMEVEEEAPARIVWLGQKKDKDDEGKLQDGDAWIQSPNAQKFRLMITAAASLGPLGLILLGFAWLEFRTRKVHSPEEVAQGLGLRVVGTVPDLGYQPHSWLRWLRPSADGNSAYAQHMLTESVDAARTMVLHAARTETLQVVMITSALAGEGKTSLASHMAASLARTGRRTLLIDCDMRNPALHHLFDLERGPGLSEILRGEADIPGVLRPTAIDNLWMVPAGISNGVSLQALAQEGVGPIFQQLRQQFDFIVVDSCPVLPVADSLLVGQHVDAVIFSLLREVSRMPKVYAAYQRLALLGIRMLGAVVNGTRDDVAVGNYHYVSPDH